MTIRIVVADDSPVIRTLVTAWLTRAGYVVSTCANGQEALLRVRKDPPDLLLTDLSMPIMDGLTLCRTLKSDPATAHVPVIVFTRMDDARDVLKGLDAGADAFVIKGAKEKDLLERVASALREGSGPQSRRGGMAREIGEQLGLTSGRKNMFKVLFAALCKEVPFDVLTIMVSTPDRKTGVVVSNNRLPPETVTQIFDDSAKTVAQLSDAPFTREGVACEEIVLEESAAPPGPVGAPLGAARVPLAADGEVFGVLSVYAFAPVPTFVDNIRFFFDVGVEAAKTLRRVSLKT